MQSSSYGALRENAKKKKSPIYEISDREGGGMGTTFQ